MNWLIDFCMFLVSSSARSSLIKTFLLFDGKVPRNRGCMEAVRHVRSAEAGCGDAGQQKVRWCQLEWHKSRWVVLVVDEMWTSQDHAHSASQRWPALHGNTKPLFLFHLPAFSLLLFWSSFLIIILYILYNWYICSVFESLCWHDIKMMSIAIIFLFLFIRGSSSSKFNC